MAFSVSLAETIWVKCTVENRKYIFFFPCSIKKVKAVLLLFALEQAAFPVNLA